MPDLTLKDRLQPSLLDRLRDDEPDKTRESREQRVLTMKKLRASVVRDLNWLFNCTHLESLQSLKDYSWVAHSVINYGLPDLVGHSVSNTDVPEMEQCLRQVIWDYEPRILHDTVKLKVNVSPEQMNRNALRFDIEGDLWAQPMPLKLYLKTEVDMETGDFSVDDLFAAGTAV